MNYYDEYDAYNKYCNSRKYDWVSPHSKRTPEEYPYSFSAHYLWKSKDAKDLKGASAVYSDRMSQWNRKKADMAFKSANVSFGNHLTQYQCNQIIDRYYDGQYRCVACALDCNVSTGYPLYIFFLKEKDKQN